MALATPHEHGSQGFEISIEAQAEMVAHPYHAGELLGTGQKMQEVVEGGFTHL
jgi:hypothetical protein